MLVLKRGYFAHCAGNPWVSREHYCIASSACVALCLQGLKKTQEGGTAWKSTYSQALDNMPWLALVTILFTLTTYKCQIIAKSEPQNNENKKVCQVIKLVLPQNMKIL